MGFDDFKPTCQSGRGICLTRGCVRGGVDRREEERGLESVMERMLESVMERR